MTTVLVSIGRAIALLFATVVVSVGCLWAQESPFDVFVAAVISDRGVNENARDFLIKWPVDSDLSVSVYVPTILDAKMDRVQGLIEPLASKFTAGVLRSGGPRMVWEYVSQVPEDVDLIVSVGEVESLSMASAMLSDSYPFDSSRRLILDSFQRNEPINLTEIIYSDEGEISNALVSMEVGDNFEQRFYKEMFFAFGVTGEFQAAFPTILNPKSRQLSPCSVDWIFLALLYDDRFSAGRKPEELVFEEILREFELED